MKINALDRFILSTFPSYGLARLNSKRVAQALQAKGGYEAAGKGPRWFRGSGTSQNFEAKKSLVHLRNAARELERNNSYVASATQVVVTNTIGAGIKPVATHPTSKRKAKLANDLMRDWANSCCCDYTGQGNLFTLQALALRTESLSGESLTVRRVVKDKNSPIPLKLQVLEPDFIDHTKDSVAGNKRIVQGVGIRDGAPESYWLHQEHPGDAGFSRSDSKETPADLVAHLYEILRPGQVRGIPRGISAYTRLKKLDDFQDARIEQQIWAAAMAAFVTSEDSESAGEILPDRLEPGMIGKLKGGESVVFSNPPTVSDHGTFVMPEQRIISAAWGITYESMTGDHTGVNFASGKMGRIQMFANIHRWRHNMFLPQWCDKVSGWFLQAAKVQGYDLDGVTISWTPPKKEILDAKNELPAIIDEIRAGLNSWQNACRERGIDPVQLTKELVEDKKLFEKYGFVLDIDSSKTTKSGQFQSVGAGGSPLVVDADHGQNSDGETNED